MAEEQVPGKKFLINPGWMGRWIWQRIFFLGCTRIAKCSPKESWLPAGYSWFQVCLLFPGRSWTSWTTRRQRNPRRKGGEGDDLALPFGRKGLLKYFWFCGHQENFEGDGILPQESMGRLPCVEIQSSWKGNQGGNKCSAPWLSMGMETPWICSVKIPLERGKAALATPSIPLYFSGNSRIWNSRPAWAEGRHW